MGIGQQEKYKKFIWSKPTAPLKGNWLFYKLGKPHLDKVLYHKRKQKLYFIEESWSWYLGVEEIIVKVYKLSIVG